MCMYPVLVIIICTRIVYLIESVSNERLLVCYLSHSDLAIHELVGETAQVFQIKNKLMGLPLQLIIYLLTLITVINIQELLQLICVKVCRETEKGSQIFHITAMFKSIFKFNAYWEHAMW